MNIIANTVKHFLVITHHKFVVLKLCIKAGIPWRGLVHDLSKYSITEFVNGVKYFNQGTASPINLEKKERGYSKAWLHHKGRNKHHPEYWYDSKAPEPLPIIPFEYMCEMICDQLAAGIVYQGKNWTKEYQLSYWNKRKENFLLNDRLKGFTTEILTQVAKNGINQTITKKNLKSCYEKHVQAYNNTWSKQLTSD